QTAPSSKLQIFFELRPSSGRLLSTPIEQKMEFIFQTEFKEAYEVLLLDIFNSDQSLFIRGDEIETLWEVVEPYLSRREELFIYPRGVSIPRQAVDFIQKDGKEWYL
ncbi:MAG: glucose-6-phosphate dehydrogenase, partial [Aquificaceae bacterium]|nr:glucose-6-phosphate dehydrogenase [Aquificaceae bacterium]